MQIPTAVEVFYTSYKEQFEMKGLDSSSEAGLQLGFVYLLM